MLFSKGLELCSSLFLKKINNPFSFKYIYILVSSLNILGNCRNDFICNFSFPLVWYLISIIILLKNSKEYHWNWFLFFFQLLKPLFIFLHNFLISDMTKRYLYHIFFLVFIINITSTRGENQAKSIIYIFYVDTSLEFYHFFYFNMVIISFNYYYKIHWMIIYFEVYHGWTKFMLKDQKAQDYSWE